MCCMATRLDWGKLKCLALAVDPTTKSRGRAGFTLAANEDLAASNSDSLAPVVTKDLGDSPLHVGVVAGYDLRANASVTLNGEVQPSFKAYIRDENEQNITETCAMAVVDGVARWSACTVSGTSAYLGAVEPRVDGSGYLATTLHLYLKVWRFNDRDVPPTHVAAVNLRDFQWVQGVDSPNAATQLARGTLSVPVRYGNSDETSSITVEAIFNCSSMTFNNGQEVSIASSVPHICADFDVTDAAATAGDNDKCGTPPLPANSNASAVLAACDGQVEAGDTCALRADFCTAGYVPVGIMYCNSWHQWAGLSDRGSSVSTWACESQDDAVISAWNTGPTRVTIQAVSATVLQGAADVDAESNGDFFAVVTITNIRDLSHATAQTTCPVADNLNPQWATVCRGFAPAELTFPAAATVFDYVVKVDLYDDDGLNVSQFVTSFGPAGLDGAVPLDTGVLHLSLRVSGFGSVTLRIADVRSSCGGLAAWVSNPDSLCAHLYRTSNYSVAVAEDESPMGVSWRGLPLVPGHGYLLPNGLQWQSGRYLSRYLAVDQKFAIMGAVGAPDKRESNRRLMNSMATEMNHSGMVGMDGMEATTASSSGAAVFVTGADKDDVKTTQPALDLNDGTVGFVCTDGVNMGYNLVGFLRLDAFGNPLNVPYCEDIDECITSPCGASATCTNTIGSFSCSCNSGFQGDGIRCVRLPADAVTKDLCADAATGTQCAPEAVCMMTTVNNQSSYACQCPNGFNGDPHKACLALDDDRDCSDFLGMDDSTTAAVASGAGVLIAIIVLLIIALAATCCFYNRQQLKLMSALVGMRNERHPATMTDKFLPLDGDYERRLRGLESENAALRDELLVVRSA